MKQPTDYSLYFIRITDLHRQTQMAGPAGAPWTTSLYADSGGAVAELHFFDQDDFELDNTGFESCAVGETHVGILSLIQTVITAAATVAGTTLPAQAEAMLPKNIAKIRVVHGGSIPGNAIYIAQCGTLLDQYNTTTNAWGVSFLNSVSQPYFETIYEAGYKDVGFVTDSDPAMTVAFGSPDDQVAQSDTGPFSLISLIKRALQQFASFVTDVALRTLSHRVFREYSCTDIGQTALTLDAYIRSKGKEPLAERTHIEFTNTHATAKMYVKRWVPGGTVVTSGVYQYYLAPVGGYVKIPATIATDITFISDTASTSALICELG